MESKPISFVVYASSFFGAIWAKRNRLSNLFSPHGEADGVGVKKEVGHVQACCCSAEVSVKDEIANNAVVAKSANSFFSVLVGLFVAFFPKCPVCWAAYMSMFGGFSISRLPYQGWLYPVLIGFLSLHLILVFLNRRRKGLGPFTVSLAGVLTILISRMLGFENNYTFIIGMLGILSGSLWNSFSIAPLKIPSLLKPFNS